jgi:hypothetical protein
MTNMKKVIGILILCLLKLLLMVDAFQFDLPARDFKCFREELVDNFDVYGEYDVGPGHSQKIDFRVIDSKGDLLVDRRNVKSGDFSFKTKEGGEHSFCFFNRLSAGAPYHQGLSRRISFDVLTGSETFDYEQLARKEHLKPVEVNLRMMEDIVKGIHAEYVYFRNRESGMRGLTESTNWRITYIGLLSIFLMFGLAAGQIYYLRTFFIKKKLI